MHARSCAESRRESTAELGGEEQAELERSHAVLELLNFVLEGVDVEEVTEEEEDEGKKAWKRKRRRKRERIPRNLGVEC